MQNATCGKVAISISSVGIFFPFSSQLTKSGYAPPRAVERREDFSSSYFQGVPPWPPTCYLPAYMMDTYELREKCVGETEKNVRLLSSL